MNDLSPSPAYDLVRRIDLRGDESEGWFVLLRPSSGEPAFIEDLEGEASARWDRKIRVIDVSQKGVSELCHLLRQPADDGVVLVGMDNWSDEQLQSLDIRRSSLARRGFVVVLLNMGGIRRLFQNAPNLRSWIGGSQFQTAPDPGRMNAEEKRARLAALREHHKLSDEDVVRMAKAGTLPVSPEFAEWLVLLDRGDLVQQE
jgi:hypothetical protein